MIPSGYCSGVNGFNYEIWDLKKEKIGGRNNFKLSWVKVCNFLIQQDLHKALEGTPVKTYINMDGLSRVLSEGYENFQAYLVDKVLMWNKKSYSVVNQW